LSYYNNLRGASNKNLQKKIKAIKQGIANKKALLHKKDIQRFWLLLIL
jgi:hypothetical protein